MARTRISTTVDADRLDTFFRVTHPPGFWGAVARRCEIDGGPSRRRFWRAIAATGLATASVFALIVGGGTFILHAPIPGGLPRGLWVGGLVAIGLALVPAWRALAGEPHE